MSIIWQKLIRPMVFGLDAERAHELGIEALRLGLGGIGTAIPSDLWGDIKRFGLDFDNPIGVAAGFDKNGRVVNQLSDLGFGFVEVGTVTYESQPGNPKPRLFRLPGDEGLINRLGFNNDGAQKVAERLAKLRRKCIVGVNIGKNKDVLNENAAENYLGSFNLLHPVADYIAINISSPNTPNLRELQKPEKLEHLLRALQKRNVDLGTKPLLVKIAPDLTDPDIEVIVDIAMRLDVSGVIATNTTISRGGLTTVGVEEIGAGGLSGRPLTRRSTEVIAALWRYSRGKMPIIGVGGIFTAEDALEKIAAGASLLQAYTGFVYRGPSFARELNLGLAALIKEKGFDSIDEAVGSAILD